MSENVDYEELVDKTISEIKEQIKSMDEPDLEKLLEAEKSNKDRKTLKSWIEEKIEESEEAEESVEDEEEEKSEEESETDSEESKGTEEPVEEEKEEKAEELQETGEKEVKSPWKKPSTNFLLGVLIGVAVTALLMYSPGTPKTVNKVAPSEASDLAIGYIQDQLSNQTQVNISLAGVDKKKYSDIYVVRLKVDTSRGSQELDVYVTKNTGIMFLGPLAGAQPIDLEEGTPVGNMVASGSGVN